MNRGRVKLFKPNSQVDQTYHPHNFLKKIKLKKKGCSIVVGLVLYTGHVSWVSWVIYRLAKVS